ncbi:MAG TPA: aminotransferase [Clostridiaceae bacterium]|nr:aminotransferase [Clostridiaceae bacterium]
MNQSDIQKALNNLEERYAKFKEMNLKLDMTRGRPCTEQLDLSNGLFSAIDKYGYKTENGIDCRNYGGLEGIPEARRLFAQILEVEPDEVIIGGNSSLNLMYDAISIALRFGTGPNSKPWSHYPKVKFLCPSPGYDRHFAMLENFGIEMIAIDMKKDGPDMDAVEKLAAEDEGIKGIWCVPKYSNPDGITYSDETVDRLAGMKTAADDFRIFYDNAYVVHHLTDNPDRLKNIMASCKKAGNPDRVYIFSSTSKITFPGSGISALAASRSNIEFIKKHISFQTIGPNKLNQLAHVHFLRDLKHIEEHMKKHAAILRPKFDLVLDTLERELGGKNIAWWNRPNGGYFISLFTLDGCAKEVVKLAKEAGVSLTGAGATYPYGKDPRDRNIRIAPTMPPLNELKLATELLCICVQLASYRKMLENGDCA